MWPWLCVLCAGAQVFEKVVVEKVEVKNGRVWGVKTNQGFIQCEIFVNCAGQVSYHGARWQVKI